MTVTAQDDHFTAGAQAACDLKDKYVEKYNQTGIIVTIHSNHDGV